MIPKLRFPEFNDSWHKISISEIAEICGGGTPDTAIPEYWGNEINWFTPTEIGKSKFVSDSKRKISRMGLSKSSAKILPEGTILLSTRATIGETSITTKKSTTNQGFQNLIVRDSFDIEFVYYLIETLRKELLRRSSGSTFLEISKKEIAKIICHLPTYNEQEKIAALLSALDQKINLLTKKKEALETYKKGLMQKIFSQELRFKREDGTDYPEWEAKHLGELCSITTGKLDANAQVEDGRYLFFTCAKEVFRIDEYAFEGASLLISGNGANVGYIHNYEGRFNAYQRTYVLQNIGVNRYYLQYYLEQNLQRRIHREKKDGNTPYIVMSTLTMMKIALPSENEAKKIAKAMMTIDESLEQLTNKLNSTVALKKGLLQQMFV